MTVPRDWTTLQLTVATPLFNSGAVSSSGAVPGDAGVRVPSIRGALRFWFRALAGAALGDNLPLLAFVESEVFGSTGAASPVKMRIRRQPKASRDQSPEFLTAQGRGDHGKWLVYLLGQGLAKPGSRTQSATLLRPFVAPDQQIDLELRFSGCEEVDSLVLAALWLLCAYGGLGSRARRGFGNIHITGVNGYLPAGWTEASVRTPGLAHYEQLHELWPHERMLDWLTQILTVARGKDSSVLSTPSRDEMWQTNPGYPVLSRTWTRAACRRTGVARPEWTQVLGYAGQQYRLFRANRDTPGVPYQPQVKTSEWFETIHGDDDHFALGALGLPIVFKGDECTVNAVSRSGEQLRRASPLWIRAAGNGSQWRLFTYAFRSDFLPDDISVRLRSKGKKEVVVSNIDVQTLTDRWINAVAEGKDLSDGRNIGLGARRSGTRPGYQ